MPKYWGKQIFTHGRFPEVGEKQKAERRKKRERKIGETNGQLRFVRNHVWRTQARLDPKNIQFQVMFLFWIKLKITSRAVKNLNPTGSHFCALVWNLIFTSIVRLQINTPGTRGWSRLRDRRMALKSIKKHAKISFYRYSF